MPGIDVKENTIRIRQKEPGLFDQKTFRTITLSKGVKAVVGKLKGQKTMTIQTLIFDKKYFDAKKARDWAKKHKTKYTEERIMQVKAKMKKDKISFEEEDIYSKIKSIAERLETAEKIEDAKALANELKGLIPINGEGDDDVKEEQTKEEEGQKEEEKEENKEEEKKEEEKVEETTEDKPEEPKPEEKVEEAKTEENTKLSEALQLNDKILTALKESELESDKLNKDLTEQATRFQEQVEILNNVNMKHKEQFNELVDNVTRFLRVLEEERIQKFNEHVDEVLTDYCSFMRISDETERKHLKETMSKWSEDMLAQTKNAISAKRSKKAAKEPVVLTTPSSKLKESTKFTNNEWNKMTQENKTNFFYKKFLESNKE